MSANAKYTGGTWNRYDTSMPSWNIFLAPSSGADFAGIRRASAGSGAITWADFLRITNTGNVGIGTTSPSSPAGFSQVLQLRGSTASFVADSNGTARAEFAVSSSGGWVSTSDSIPLRFATGSVERVRVDASGNVGVGTAAPGYKLDVVSGGQWAARFKKTDATNGGILVESAAGYNPNVALSSGGTIKWYVNSNVSNGDALQFWESTGINPRLTVTQGGNVGVGKSNPSVALDVVGDIAATGNIAAKYQDVAEWVPSTQKLAAGTVVVLDAGQANHVLASTRSYDTGVAGVVSERPGIALGEAGEGKLLVATTGRVKVKVDATRAPIRVGDLLVTSDVEGVAMKSEPLDLGGVPIHRPGTLIGKALEPLASGTGEILVLLSLQ